MHAERVPLERVRAWGQVAAAITLVAEDRCVAVSVANIPDALRVALGLRPDAERCGVSLTADLGPNGEAMGVTARRL